MLQNVFQNYNNDDDDPGWWWWGDNHDDEEDEVDEVLALNIIFLPTVLFNPYKR